MEEHDGVDIELYFYEPTESCQKVDLYAFKNSDHDYMGSWVMDSLHLIALQKKIYTSHYWVGMHDITRKVTLCKIGYNLKPYSAIKSFLLEELSKAEKIKKYVKNISITDKIRELP